MDNSGRMWFLADMSKSFRPWDVDQAWLFPPSVRDLVPPDHLAHLIRDTVRDSLDLSEILAAYDEERGYPPYHPAMMTALLLYGYSQGVYSSRRLAKACQERVDFMAVTAMQTPDFRTISDFRKRHHEALANLFGQVLGLCQRAGLVRLGHVALDGTKIKANASRHKAMSYGRMKVEVPRLAAEVKRWFKEADKVDRSEDKQHGPTRRGDEMPSWVANKQERLAKMREAMAAMESEAREGKPTDGTRGGRAGGKSEREPGTPPDRAQRNFTDPESRIMLSKEGFIQAYNPQLAVDSEHQIIVARDVTTSAADVGQLIPMVTQIETNTGHLPEELSADAGYCSEENLGELRRRRIKGYIAIGRLKHGAKAPRAHRGKPAGPLVLDMWAKLKRGGHRSRYRLRKQIVEPAIGQIKQARSFRQFLLRGVAKVRSEWSLVCTAHNLLKWAAATA